MDINRIVKKAVMLDDQGPGVWRTIRGTPVFIKEGQSVEDAINEKFGLKAIKVSKQESEKLKRMLDKNGGFSYQPVLKSSPVDGFMVSPYKEREKVMDLNDVDDKTLHDYIEKNSDLLSKTDHHIGGWNDSGKTYLDVSVRYETKEQAQKFAKEHKQIAFFDIKEGKTIYTDKGGNDDGKES